MKEIWKDIEGYEGLYQVNIKGQVKSLERSFYIGKWKDKQTSRMAVPEKIIGTSLYATGYKYVTLSKKGKIKKFKVHRLIAIYFIDNPDNLPFINHINADRGDNRIENLEWCTHSHNMKHKFKLGNQSNAGGNNAMAKPVFDSHTGIYYDCMGDLCLALSISRDKVYGSFPDNKRVKPNEYKNRFVRI